MASARSAPPRQQPAWLRPSRSPRQILLARCFWRSRIWLRSRLASWAAVSSLGTACARAGAGWGLAVAALGALAPASGGASLWMRTLRSQSRCRVLLTGYHRLPASAAQSPSPPTTTASRLSVRRHRTVASCTVLFYRFILRIIYIECSRYNTETHRHATQYTAPVHSRHKLEQLAS